MNLEKAVEAAIDAACTTRMDFTFEDIRQVVGAAAPFIAAQALRDEAERIAIMNGVPIDHLRTVADHIDARADRLDPQ